MVALAASAVRYGTANGEWNVTVAPPSREAIMARQRSCKRAAGVVTTKLSIGAEGSPGVIPEGPSRSSYFSPCARS
ncbi:FAD-binding domain-containing protein [Phanerochaete sordida]|uniref:FAD-binding domain-containing protein n=1 Tax=Phanerochaete sordida TaxID=48140 RepID=A0A9P3LKQ7_9APHY|nr:FAD-binding domain-containing protein [Phanerochaete sordida]